jgi:hypothetical protein
LVASALAQAIDIKLPNIPIYEESRARSELKSLPQPARQFYFIYF